MNQEEQGDKASQTIGKAAVQEVIPATTSLPATPHELSDEDLAAVAGGTTSNTSEGVKKTMQTQV